MKVLLFDKNFNCYASLSRKTVTVEFLQMVKGLGGFFLDCPVEYVGMISGRGEEEAINSIMRDLRR